MIAEAKASHQVMEEAMATSTHGDLCPGSRWVWIVLRNLSTQELQISPKTVIGSVQKAKTIPNLKVFKQMTTVLLSKEQVEPSKMSCPNGSNFPEKSWPSQPLYHCSWDWMFQSQIMTSSKNSISWGTLNGTPLIIKRPGIFWKNMQMPLLRVILI